MVPLQVCNVTVQHIALAASQWSWWKCFLCPLFMRRWHYWFSCIYQSSQSERFFIIPILCIQHPWRFISSSISQFFPLQWFCSFVFTLDWVPKIKPCMLKYQRSINIAARIVSMLFHHYTSSQHGQPCYWNLQSPPHGVNLPSMLHCLSEG